MQESGEYAVAVVEVDAKARVNGKRVKANKTITVFPRAQLAADIREAIADGRLLDIIKKENRFLLGYEGPIPKQPYKNLFSRRI